MRRFVHYLWVVAALAAPHGCSSRGCAAGGRRHVPGPSWPRYPLPARPRATHAWRREQGQPRRLAEGHRHPVDGVGRHQRARSTPGSSATTSCSASRQRHDQRRARQGHPVGRSVPGGQQHLAARRDLRRPGQRLDLSSHGHNDIRGGPGNDHIWGHYGHGTIDCGSGWDVVHTKHHSTYKLRNCERHLDH